MQKVQVGMVMLGTALVALLQLSLRNQSSVQACARFSVPGLSQDGVVAAELTMEHWATETLSSVHAAEAGRNLQSSHHWKSRVHTKQGKGCSHKSRKLSKEGKNSRKEGKHRKNGKYDCKEHFFSEVDEDSNDNQDQPEQPEDDAAAREQPENEAGVSKEGESESEVLELAEDDVEAPERDAPATRAVTEEELAQVAMPMFPDVSVHEEADQGQAGVKAVLTYWHDVALKTHQRDYSKRALGRADERPTQPGPAYSARAMTMVHLAMYDAYTGITGEGTTYLTYTPPQPHFSDAVQPVAGAVAAGSAAYLALVMLFPDDTEALRSTRDSFIDALEHSVLDRLGIRAAAIWGRQVACEIFASRDEDGAFASEPFVSYNPTDFPSGPYEHIPDPTARDDDGDPQTLYSPHWGTVRPFGYERNELMPNFLPDPLELAYRGNFTHVNISDLAMYAGEKESAVRTEDQTIAGIFWAYDGVMLIGGPIRLYNRITDVAVKEALAEGAPELATAFQLARLYAVLHIAMNDATIACWRDKYNFNFWRPIIGIRNAEQDTVYNTGDMRDPTWTQLGAPRTNAFRPGINPAFPAYPSGHATVATSAFTVVKALLNIPEGREYPMESDEFNGVNKNEFGVARPRLVRTMSFESAIKENERSRIYLGVHWDFDCTEGSKLGMSVAEDVLVSFPAASA